MSKQLLRSGTAIGAMICGAEHAESGKDFRHKMNIGLKEAHEIRYWLDMLHQANYIDKATYKSFSKDVTELIKLLASTLKSLKNQS